MYYIDISFYPINQPQTSLKKTNLNNPRIKTVTISSKIISNLIYNKNNTHIESRVGMYEIPCLVCNKIYEGETCFSLNKQIY